MVRSWYKNVLFLIIGLAFALPGFAQQTAGIKITDIKYTANKIIIGYDIVNYKKNDRFAIWVDVYYENDSLCKEAITLEGDIGTKIKGGTDKIITWDLKADNVFVDETLKIEVIGKYMDADLGIVEAMLYSAAFPGLGNYKLTRKKSYYAVGAAAYTCLGISISLNSSYRKNFDKYLKSTSINESDDLFRKTKNQKLGSKIFGYTALGIWVADLIITRKQAKEKSESKGVALKRKRFDYFFSYDPYISAPTLNLKINF